MAQRNDHAHGVDHVEACAGQLAIEAMRAQDRQASAHLGVGGEKHGHEEAEEGDHFIGRQPELADALDGAVAEDPEGESGEGKADGAKIGDGGFHGLSSV